jgi:hypothetical protein
MMLESFNEVSESRFIMTGMQTRLSVRSSEFPKFCYRASRNFIYKFSRQKAAKIFEFIRTKKVLIK